MSRPCFSLLATAVLLLQLPVFAGDTKSPGPSDRMTPQTRTAVIRDLTAERVFVRRTLPLDPRGLVIKDGKITPTERQVEQLVLEKGFAANAGDRVIITNVTIKEKEIVLEINGGPKKKEKWYQHVSVGMGGGTTPVGGAPKSLEATGSVVTLEFDKYVPELTGNQVRAMLAPVFDFKALTQAEAYEKTLPPKVQEAIKDHKVLVGMDRDMVIYAMGRPPQKIRDKDEKGNDYEEWIYGTPPQEVQFVRFEGPVVTRLEIMTVDGEKIVRTQREVDLPSAETEVAKKTEPAQSAPPPTLRRPGEEAEVPSDTQSAPPQVERLPPISGTPSTGAPSGPD
jgi:hypothetical protein